MISADSSAIISMSVNCITRVLREFGKEISIPPGVYNEIITRPIHSRRFALGSMRIKKLVEDGVLKVRKANPELTDRILSGFNSAYFIRGHALKIIHLGEAEALALTKDHKTEAFLIDERTTRLLLEDPEQLRKLLSNRNKSKVTMNLDRINKVKELLPTIPIIRSTEVAAVAYERGILSKYMSEGDGDLIDALLSALKYSGCAITWNEIEEYKATLR